MKAKFIIPPTEIRIIIEKAAGFVAKNGREFEEKIMENERNNPKFSFMNMIDPYHLYYRKRLEELIEGGPDAISKAITDSKASEAQNSVNIDTTHQEGTLTAAEEVAKLDDLEFLIQFPTISAIDLDIIKLTAQFAAKNGKQFILHLAQKESRNPQFDFLKPHHNLHQFYQTLLKQYALVFEPTESLLDRVKRCAHQKYEQLSLITHRARMEKLERDQMEQLVGIEEAEREAFTKINWHDFSIAETVMFGAEDKNLDLPAPISVDSLKTMPITQRLEIWTGRKIELNSATGTDVAAPVSFAQNEDEEEMEIDEDVEFASLPTPVTLPAKRANEVIMGAAFGGAPVKVRTDYVPRTSSSSASTLSKAGGEEACQVCSICKASVPVSQIDEHIRIELLDPKWRQQRMAMLSKNRDSNVLETGIDVSRNLEQLARNRADIFGSSGSNSNGTNTIERGPTRPIWDGNADSIAQINRAAQIMAKPQIEQEMAALQRAGDYSLDPSKGIGPRIPQAQPRPPFMPPMPGMPYPPGMHFPPGVPLPPGMLPPGMPYFPGMPFPPGMPPPPPLPPQAPSNQPQEKKQ